jgi:hypothetical protein
MRGTPADPDWIYEIVIRGFTAEGAEPYFQGEEEE